MVFPTASCCCVNLVTREAVANAHHTQHVIERYIAVDPDICHGKPCFKGTRIMVSTVLELLETGESYTEIHKAYPSLTPAHIRAALHVAHHLLDQNRVTTFQHLLHAAARLGHEVRRVPCGVTNGAVLWLAPMPRAS